MRIACLIAVLCGALSPAAAQELRRTHLDLTVALDYATSSLEATAQLWFVNRSADSVTRVPLQINRGFRVRTVRDGAGGTLPVEQAPAPLAGLEALVVQQAWVSLARPIPPGDSATVIVTYGGTLMPYADAGFGYVHDTIAPAFTILRADAWAIPAIATPSVQAVLTALRTEFTFTAAIEAPAEVVVATGVAPDTVERHTRAAVWRFRSRSAVPFLNIAVAPYRVVERGGIRVFHFAEDSTGAAALLGAALRATGAYARWFGELEHPPTLHVMEIPEGWGSQASLAGGIIQTADAFRTAAAHPQLYHELAHLWHPDERDDPPGRWTEGLATFLQWRVAAEVDGAPDLDSAAMAAAARAGASAPAGVAMRDFGRHQLTDNAYRVGAVMCWLLYRVLGGDAFDRVMGEWMRTRRATGDTAAGFAAFLRARVPAAGPVLSDWLETPAWITRLQDTSLAEVLRGYRTAAAGS